MNNTNWPHPGPVQRPNWGQDDTNCPILHVDMDSFFAAVEVLDNPGLKGKPVIVGGVDRGVVCSASYEARHFGVRSGMPIFQARRACPLGVYLHSRHSRYQEVSAQVMAVLGSFTAQMEQVSVDEAFLDVAGARRRLGSPTQIGQLLREQVQAQCGVPASVGIGENKMLAKLASVRAKPNGLLVIPAHSTQEFLATLSVGALAGVGGKTREQLHRYGIDTVVELRRYTLPDLQRFFGAAAGLHLFNSARGVDTRRVETEREEKSLSSEMTFFEPLYSPDLLQAVLLDQAHQCGARLRRLNTRAGGVSIKLRSAEFVSITRSRGLQPPSNLAADIYEAAADLLRRETLPSAGVRLLGLRVDRLETNEWGIQGQLGEDGRGQAREEALDQVVSKFGRGSLVPASLLKKPWKKSPEADSD